MAYFDHNFSPVQSMTFLAIATLLVTLQTPKASRLAQVDVLNGVTISGTASGALDIILSANAAEIEGTILDRERKPAASVQAVLIPDRERDRPDLYSTAVSDQ